jgi:Zn-finger nucleic acid-binding protein
MNCPKCVSETLREISLDEVTVDRCPSCNGIWSDERELSRLLAEDAHQLAALRSSNENDLADNRKGRCPRDSSALLRVFSSIDRSVTLDVCPDCHGIWIDGGEFEKLFAARRS